MEEVIAPGCGLFFCWAHLTEIHYHRGVAPKPELPGLAGHLLVDPDWERWRTENPELVAALLLSTP
ncbi:hypothetical protein [Leifsonia sp. Leaf264]|uniref:hypothetical protein n=1 Tax=Leifsonia sp. Leaf264 TaxID=1736314 RepID=UPI001910B213|nr:hypothetical protein [Leifsonia sp. Leaf264]